jgi:hypothetical protein
MEEKGYYWPKVAGFTYSSLSSLVDLVRWGVRRTPYGGLKRQAS